MPLFCRLFINSAVLKRTQNQCTNQEEIENVESQPGPQTLFWKCPFKGPLLQAAHLCPLVETIWLRTLRGKGEAAP
jgi:hypothetical protein